MKRNKNQYSGFSIFGFVMFFLTITVTSTSAIFVYQLAKLKTNNNTLIIIISVIGVILFGAVICTLCDMLRRKIMIEKPVKKILDATESIASGDFSIKLQHDNDYMKYDPYDLIFDNINTMTAELSKNEILKNDFISNVSHEIKTPLSVLQNYAKILQNENLSKEKRDEYLKGILLQTQKLSELVSNILKLSKLENQQIVPEIEEFDLSELVRICVLGFENILEKKKLTLECNIDEVKVKSSKSLLELVINNLISNAIKFTNPNGKISVSLKNLTNIIEIKIQDTGCGISKDVGAHIFEKFYQGDTTRSSEGNGLGLSLVKKVIDIIGGEIYVESKVNVGSTFTIKLKKE